MTRLLNLQSGVLRRKHRLKSNNIWNNNRSRFFFVESQGIWLTSSKYFLLQFFTSIKSFNINTKGDSSEKGMHPAIYECVMNKSYFHLAFMIVTKNYFLLVCLKAGGSVAGCHAISWQQHSGATRFVHLRAMSHKRQGIIFWTAGPGAVALASSQR